MFQSLTGNKKAEKWGKKTQSGTGFPASELPGRLDNAQICEQMVYYLTPTSFTWFTVEAGEAGVWAHTAICWRKKQQEDKRLISPHRRAKTPQHGSRKCLWQPHRQIHPKSGLSLIKKNNRSRQNVKLGLLNRSVKRWSEVCKGSGLNLEENSMFPGLVRLVSMVLLVSMAFHQAHLATPLNTLNDSGGSPRTKNTGSVREWRLKERSCCLQEITRRSETKRCLNRTAI